MSGKTLGGREGEEEQAYKKEEMNKEKEKRAMCVRESRFSLHAARACSLHTHTIHRDSKLSRAKGCEARHSLG